MKIIVAEDDVASARALRWSLERENHEVRVAGSAEEAWNLLEAESAQVLLSDWNMPEMSGLELCARIRRRTDLAYPYFILLTGVHLGREHLREAMAAGVDDYLPKPVDQEVLFMRLRVAARIHHYHSQISVLRDLLPICMYCKRIRSDQDYWQQVECYFHEHAGSCFSHGVCPDCFLREHGAASLSGGEPGSCVG